MSNGIITHYVTYGELTGFFDEYTSFDEDENGNVLELEIDVDLLKSQVQYAREKLLTAHKDSDIVIESVDIRGDAIHSMEYTVTEKSSSPVLYGWPWIRVNENAVYCIDVFKWINGSVEINLSDLVTPTETED
jgi:hypothetical protein